MIRCKRVYDAVEDDDGQRVLVDRLWPRNKRKQDLQGQWLREVAPSNDLRKAFHQREVDYPEFVRLYRQELAAHPEYWYPLLDVAAKGNLTLLYAARDHSHNNAQVLADWLEEEGDRRQAVSSPVCYLR